MSWLAVQQTYPQLYWQQRNGDEEAAVLGAITRFRRSDQAQRFLRQHPEHADLRIWGLNAFTRRREIYFYPAWNGDAVAVEPAAADAIQRKLPSARCDSAKEFIATLGEYQALAWVTFNQPHGSTWPDKTGWTQLIELATKTIAEGELDKVVLARATDLHFASPVNAAAMMAAVVN